MRRAATRICSGEELEVLPGFSHSDYSTLNVVLQKHEEIGLSAYCTPDNVEMTIGGRI